MNKLRILSILCLLGAAGSRAASPSLVTLVNPLQGTDSNGGYSHGNEYPAISLPFPMNTWAPYTRPASDSFYYQYHDTKIRGIRQTHQPSPWIAEVTPTERCARFRFTFEQPGDSYVVLDAFSGGSSVEIIPVENKVIGISRFNHGGVPTNFANYFVIVFDRPFSAHGVWSSDFVQTNATKLDSKHAGAYLKFETTPDGLVGCKVASSFISPEQAQRNLQREVGDADFDTIRLRAEQSWNQALGRVRIEGGLEDQRRTFYSALYRSIVYPHRFYEYNEANHPAYFSPYDGKVHEGVLYTDTGFWDTFRAAHPLYNLLFPEISAEILQGLLNAYDQSGWLPSWSSPGHRNCMIGNHAFSLLADGWAKGVRSFDSQKAVGAMLHDATNQAPDFCRAIGRDGAEFYDKLGFVPYSSVRGEPSFAEATAKTLEYAYDDFCAAQLARAVGRQAEAEQFNRKSMNYTNLFDTKTGFMRGRKADGSWCEPFDPTEWGGPFTEGCSWHWTWSVMQDVPGLIKLMGGPGLCRQTRRGFHLAQHFQGGYLRPPHP
jgi:predicted alpha-1,2-mannosidase